MSGVLDEEGDPILNLADGERDPLLLGVATGAGSSDPNLDDARQFPAALAFAFPAPCRDALNPPRARSVFFAAIYARSARRRAISSCRE